MNKEQERQLQQQMQDDEQVQKNRREKAEKLMEGLKGEGISVTYRNIAKYMASNGVMVTPKVGRKKGHVTMPGAAYGVKPEKMDETGRTFYEGRVTNGYLSFFPKEAELKMDRLEKQLRRAVEGRTVADIFMPVTAYDSLRKDFERIRKEYFETRDELLADWDNLIASFQDGAKAMLDGIPMPAKQRSQLMDEFMSAAPTAKEFYESVYMDLRVCAFPAEVGNLQGLGSSIAADVTETWKDDVLETAFLAIERQIGEGWVCINKALKYYLKNSKFNGASNGSLKKWAEKLAWKNVFRNPLLTDLHDQIMRIDTYTSSDDEASILEECLVDIYEYAQEAKLDLDWSNVALNKSVLASMSQVKALDAKRASAGSQTTHAVTSVSSDKNNMPNLAALPWENEEEELNVDQDFPVEHPYEFMTA